VTGKVVLITGAGRACGRALAEDLAARGAAVVVNDIDADGGRQTVQRIEAAGGAATFVQADVSVDAEVEALVDRCLELHGRLDGAVNNAGVELPVAVADSDAPSFARVLATNLEGVRACLKHEIRAMRRTGGGAIVNMSSVTSDLTAAPLNGLYGGQQGRRGRADEGGRGGGRHGGHLHQRARLPRRRRRERHVPALLADTGLPQEQILAAVPIGRLLAPAELCAAVRFLLSDEARFVVGTTLVLDGGFTAT
jgi:NAD(P)-dependent dehydrogenase (short-subunit alcohol dehydrogenase family)